VKSRESRWRGKKLHVYIPPEMLAEIRAEAVRLDTKVSVLMRRAWRIARPAIANLPTS
jgi:uncharacterized small protein (TIGR04563 family)